MTDTESSSVLPDNVVREVIADAVALHGLKRGLPVAASLMGVSERWLRAIRYGEPARISADTYCRALAARRTLLDARRNRLLAELRHLEATRHGTPVPADLCDVGPHLGLGSAAGGVVGQAGGPLVRRA